MDTRILPKRKSGLGELELSVRWQSKTPSVSDLQHEHTAAVASQCADVLCHFESVELIDEASDTPLHYAHQ